MNPEKVGQILYLFCLGVSQSQMVKRHKICHKTIKHTLTEYADHLGKWTEVGARLSKQLFLNLHSLEEDIIEKLRERMEGGKLKATFRDIYYVSTAKEKSWQQAHRIEERREDIRYARNVVTQEKYEKVLARARGRMRGSLS
jgi:glycerol dehydrogenase-like iron-containing ADH family enzyme